MCVCVCAGLPEEITAVLRCIVSALGTVDTNEVRQESSNVFNACARGFTYQHTVCAQEREFTTLTLAVYVYMCLRVQMWVYVRVYVFACLYWDMLSYSSLSLSLLYIY